MRAILLTLLLLAAVPSWAAVYNPKDIGSAPQSARDAFAAMDELRASQMAAKDAGKQSFNAEEIKTDPIAIRATKAQQGFIAAQRACLIEYFKPDAMHATPISQPKTDADRAVNQLALGYPWDGLPNDPQQFGAWYAKAHHVEWLEELCDGGIKRYSATTPVAKAQAHH